MARLPSATHVPSPPDRVTGFGDLLEYLDDLSKYLRHEIELIKHEFNGRIEIINQRVATVTVSDTGNADTDFEVEHNLGIVPRFYIWNINKAGIVYKGSGTWTATSIYLRCSAANAEVKVIVIP